MESNMIDVIIKKTSSMGPLACEGRLPRRTVLALLFVGALFSTTVAGAMTYGHTAGGKDTKPDDPAYSYSREVFDCTGRDTLTLVPVLIDTLRDDTTGGQNNLSSYACRAWSEAGPEHIYRLEVTEDLELWAALRDLEGVDLDLFLLSDCDTDACMAGENEELSALLGVGTYYLIIDGFGSATPAEGPYTLALECRYPGVPPGICQPGGATTVDCDTDTTSFEANLFEAPNQMQTYDCSLVVERGGDHWYAVTLPTGYEFQVKLMVVPGALDMALWMFDGCGPEAVCLGFADESGTGLPESLDWINETGGEVTVYVAVDSFRPAASEADGSYTVDFYCPTNVANEKTSLGSLRALYR